jgi:hypothetical protein
MKLFDYETYEDFGKEWFFQVLTSRKFALLDITVQWDDFGSDAIFPEFSLCINSATLLAFFIRYKRFEFDLSVITARPRNLQWYRRNHDD